MKVTKVNTVYSAQNQTKKNPNSEKKKEEQKKGVSTCFKDMLDIKMGRYKG